MTGVWHTNIHFDVCPLVERFQRGAPGQPAPLSGGLRAASATWKTKKRRFKIVLTHGAEKYQLLWLSHIGDSVMCGRCGTPFKTSYHWSGRIHEKFTGNDEACGRRNRTAFPDLDKVESLHRLRFPKDDLLTQYRIEVLDPKKLDGQMSVDLQSLSPGGAYVVELGIVGSGGPSGVLRISIAKDAEVEV